MQELNCAKNIAMTFNHFVSFMVEFVTLTADMINFGYLFDFQIRTVIVAD